MNHPAFTSNFPSACVTLIDRGQYGWVEALEAGRDLHTLKRRRKGNVRAAVCKCMLPQLRRRAQDCVR